MSIQKLLSRSRWGTMGSVPRALAASRAGVEYALCGRTNLIVIILLVGVAVTSEAAFASTITVNTLNDETPPVPSDMACSLREAIINANSTTGDMTGGDCAAGTGNDTIVFGVSGQITLNGSLPDIRDAFLTIDGGDAITVDGAGKYQIFSIEANSAVSLNNLTVADAGSSGVYNFGVITVSNSTFSGNSSIDGGAIYNYDGTLNVYSSMFSRNSASDAGGAIFNRIGVVYIANSTFFDNGALNMGGAISNATNQLLTVSNCTFGKNYTESAGGGTLFNDIMGVLNVFGSILADSGTGGDCASTGFLPTDQGGNIDDDGTCKFGTSTGPTGANGQTLGDGVNPALQTPYPQDNGGPTLTIALQPTSPAIDAIPANQCPATDQRGVSRPDPGERGNPACDVGAFESSEPTPTPTATRTPTPIPTTTHTPPPSPTKTPNRTPTRTATQVATHTPARTPTRTSAKTPSKTPTKTATRKASPSPTPTHSHAPTPTATRTRTRTPTSRHTPTRTRTPTHTPTRTRTPTHTPTRTHSRTPTPTRSHAPTPTRTP